MKRNENWQNLQKEIHKQEKKCTKKSMHKNSKKAKRRNDLKSCCNFWGMTWKVAASFEEWPEKLATFEDKLGQLVRGADKNTFFWRFLARFSSRFLHFHGQFVYNTDILKKKIGPSCLFFAAGTTDTKFRHSTGVTTANSTNKYQKYKSVELGDQLPKAETKVITSGKTNWQLLWDRGSNAGDFECPIIQIYKWIPKRSELYQKGHK